MIGKIMQYNKNKGYGFIIDDRGTNRFFHISNLRTKTIPKIEDAVTFEPIVLPKGLGATEVRVVRTPGDSAMLDELSEWKIEAKLEDNIRYFYHTSYVSLIEQGSRCYVIGRKGTGKTAICEHLSKKKDAKIFSKKLTFKNYPFNELYNLSNEQYTRPNQYITLWKYVIYSSIAQLMIKNEAINLAIRQKLEKIYSEDLERNLHQKITKWTSRNFKFTLFGSGLEVKKESNDNKNISTWIERVEALELFLIKNIDDANYLLLFDELDEDYKCFVGEQISQDYFSLITSLFKAVQDIKSMFQEGDYNLNPVIFLRTDIYSRMSDPDKTKWSDLTIELNWSKPLIKKMLAYRLSKAIDEDGPVNSFDDMWLRVFRPEPIQFKYGKKLFSIFDFIARNAQNRPRDFIRYIRDCAQAAKVKGNDVIDEELVRHVEKNFSAYLRSELEDEISGVIPEIHEVFNVLSSLRKSCFNAEDFSSTYETYCEQKKIACLEPKFVLDVLFNFSAIGYFTRNGKKIFSFIDSNAQCVHDAPFYIHRGLYKSLQLL